MPERLLVTTEWLHAHLGDDRLRIVGIRGHVLSPNARVAPPEVLREKFAQASNKRAHARDCDILQR